CLSINLSALPRKTKLVWELFLLLSLLICFTLQLVDLINFSFIDMLCLKKQNLHGNYLKYIIIFMNYVSRDQILLITKNIILLHDILKKHAEIIDNIESKKYFA